MTVVGQATPDEAAALIRATDADVMLWDVGVDPGPTSKPCRTPWSGGGPRSSS